MKAFWKRIKITQLVALAILLGGFGGIISGYWPKAGAVMAALGLIGTIWDHFNSNNEKKENGDFFEAQALLLFASGIGNVHTEVAKSELGRGASYHKIEERLRKALKINPKDRDALGLLGVVLGTGCNSYCWRSGGALRPISLHQAGVIQTA